MGGAHYISEILRPMPFLNVIAAGSIKTDEVLDYLEAGAFAVGIGRDFYQDKSQDEIKNAVATLKQQIKEFKARK